MEGIDELLLLLVVVEHESSVKSTGAGSGVHRASSIACLTKTVLPGANISLCVSFKFRPSPSTSISKVTPLTRSRHPRHHRHTEKTKNEPRGEASRRGPRDCIFQQKPLRPQQPQVISTSRPTRERPAHVRSNSPLLHFNKTVNTPPPTTQSHDNINNLRPSAHGKKSCIDLPLPVRPIPAGARIRAGVQNRRGDNNPPSPTHTPHWPGIISPRIISHGVCPTTSLRFQLDGRAKPCV